MTTEKLPLVLAIGTYVTNAIFRDGEKRAVPLQGVITCASLREDKTVEYGFNGSAWWPREAFTFVAEADEASLASACDLEFEGDDDEESASVPDGDLDEPVDHAYNDIRRMES